MNTLIRSLTTLVLIASGLNAGPLEKLPAEVASPGWVDRIPSPAGDREMFYLFRPGQPALFGVARTDGQVVWAKNAGLRPITRYAWSTDGRQVVFLTDCVQEDAELKSKKPETRSWFHVMDASDGRSVAQGDLDTDVLDLPKRFPAALGAAHKVEILGIGDSELSATIVHRGERVSGSRKLTELSSSR